MHFHKALSVIEVPFFFFLLEQSPGQISHQSSAIDFTSHRASRQHQSSYVSHENVTQSPNPFQHYSQCAGILTSLASASPMLSMLTRPHRPPDETPTLPPISVLTTPYALKPSPYHPYACVMPSRHASNTAYHPYAHRVPS
ncbi:hypothetical protein O181_108432 [Austropuccinia psidii MF-1]|uniref:Uncharacterized protein n=1 Tax=Austropuccinia psidii MF-1 TaxID=1389203 RepID=A0A9Q3PQD9_9BASI|nr:hypothetical protein [Austropuccinia psidii MF-1]